MMEPNNNTLPEPTRYEYKPRVSIFWPIVLIGLGALLLLSNMHYLQGDVWEWVWRLWPVIFIAWGLDALIRLELVGATMLIGFGALFLAATFGYFSMNPLGIIIRLWPIFLVSAGLEVVFSRRRTGVWGALVGALLMFVVLAFAVWQLNGQLLTMATAPGTRVTQRLEDASRANVAIARGDGMVAVKALPEPSALLDGTVRLPDNEKLSTSYAVQNGTANLSLKSEGTFVGLGPVNGDWYRWDLGLNPEVPMSLRVDQGAGEAVLDLSELKVDSVSENQAVGTTTMTLPRAGDAQARLNAAIGSVTVIVPQGVGMRLHTSGVFIGTSVPDGYAQQGALYTSPGYDGAAHQVDVYISMAFGTLSVQQQ
jgi:hypothetical protein